jgi:hypothetical protein
MGSGPTPSAQRVEALLSQMTVEEKAMQLSALYPMGLLGPEGPIADQLRAQLGQASDKSRALA